MVSDAFSQAVDRVVARAGGNDMILQKVATAFGSSDAAQVREVLAMYGGLRVTEEEARDFISQFQAQYQVDANGRYIT